MVRLVKYLKPYTLLIVLAIALLFVQANADLALPDYMSNIVDIGIQQGGVANTVPVAIRQTEMDNHPESSNLPAPVRGRVTGAGF